MIEIRLRYCDAKELEDGMYLVASQLTNTPEGAIKGMAKACVLEWRMFRYGMWSDWATAPLVKGDA